MLTNTKSSKSQKRNNFKLKGVPRSVIDELEVLAATCTRRWLILDGRRLTCLLQMTP